MSLDEMLAIARAHEMTPEEKEAQAQSFAYGNLHIENPDVTREHVASAFAKLRGGENA